MAVAGIPTAHGEIAGSATAKQWRFFVRPGGEVV